MSAAATKFESTYVLVTRSLDEDSERIELPTNEEDNTLGLQTLVGAFPSAHGLKYKNPATGAFRAVLIDPSGTKFHPPSDGWSNKVFVVLLQHNNESGMKNAVKKSDQNAKRRKLMVESDDDYSCDSDADPVGGRGGDKYESSGKRQQSASKQKRMMGKEPVSGSQRLSSDTAVEGDEMPNKIVDLLVMGLPFELTEDELRVHFEKFGKVVHSEIKTQKGQSSNRGFGFVQMGDLEVQKRVLKQKLHVIGGRECQVKIPFTKNALSSKIFVGRIKENMTAIELRRFFTEEAHKIDPDSSVTDVYIPRPFRSFAFVTFSSPAVAKELIKIGQLSIDDSSISISSAHSTRPQDGNSPHQIHPFTSSRHTLPPFQALPAEHFNGASRLSNPAEEFFGHDWYGYGYAASESMSGNQRNTAVQSIYPNRAAAAGNVLHRNPATAGNQMLNQLETLNLNNIGMPQQDIVNAAIKAIVAAAASSHQQAEVVHHRPSGSNHPQQQYMPYQSLSPPPPVATSSSASRSPIYPQQSTYNQGSGGRRNGGAVWR